MTLTISQLEGFKKKQGSHPDDLTALQNDSSIKAFLHFKCISFEYTLACVAQEYCHLKKIEDTDQTTLFNTRNTLSIGRALTYPFFIAVSNGYSKFLYTLFGNFQSLSYGPASIESYDLSKLPSDALGRQALKYFNLESGTNKVGIEVLEPAKNKTFKEIKNKLSEETVLFGGPETKFKEIEIEGDYSTTKTIPGAIEDGVKAAREKFGKDFFNADKNNVLYKASYFNAFQSDYEKNASSILRYEDIEEDKKRISRLAYVY